MGRPTARSVLALAALAGAVPAAARADFFDDVRRTFQHDIPRTFEHDIPRAFGAEPRHPAPRQPAPAAQPQPTPRRAGVDHPPSQQRTRAENR